METFWRRPRRCLSVLGWDEPRQLFEPDHRSVSASVSELRLGTGPTIHYRLWLVRIGTFAHELVSIFGCAGEALTI